MLILFEDLSQSLQVLYRYIYIKTLSDGKGLNLHQFILHIAQSDLFRMAQSSQPVRIRVHHVELVMAAQIIVLMSGRKAVTRVQYRSLDDLIFLKSRLNVARLRPVNVAKSSILKSYM